MNTDVFIVRRLVVEPGLSPIVTVLLSPQDVRDWLMNALVLTDWVVETWKVGRTVCYQETPAHTFVQNMG